jgi:hypothetical protein
MSTPAAETWLDVDQLAALIHTTPAGVYAINHDGSGPPRYRGTKKVLYKLSEVEQWLESRKVEPARAS